MCDRQRVLDATRHVLPRRPIAVDLFAGAGGMTLGFEQAGFDVVAAVEYDPVHAATHAFNFPRTEVLCRDASKVSAQLVLEAAARGYKSLYPHRRWTGVVDTLFGGPPCQGFSTGGKREDNDKRNDLLLHFVRLVEEIRPQAFCLENVAGLLESSFAPIREAALQRLQNAGYTLSGTEAPINALDFGVPQSRRRVLILGALDGVQPCRPAPTGRGVTVKQALEGLPEPTRYPALLDSDEALLRNSDLRRRLGAVSVYARVLSGLDPLIGDRSRPRLKDPTLLTCSRRTVHTDATLERFAATDPGTVEPKSRLYRLPLEGPSRTLRAGTGSERGSHTSPRPIHPVQDRVITVREAARLHGYPDWFRFHTTNWHGHRQVGNSVPPPMARAAALALREALGYAPVALRAGSSLGNPDLLRMSRDSARAAMGALEHELPATRTRRELLGVLSSADQSSLDPVV